MRALHTKKKHSSQRNGKSDQFRAVVCPTCLISTTLMVRMLILLQKAGSLEPVMSFFKESVFFLDLDSLFTIQKHKIFNRHQLSTSIYEFMLLLLSFCLESISFYFSIRNTLFFSFHKNLNKFLSYLMEWIWATLLFLTEMVWWRRKRRSTDKQKMRDRNVCVNVLKSQIER